MTKMQIVGVTYVRYTNKVGREVSGTKLYVTSDPADWEQDTVGVKTDTIFVSDRFDLGTKRARDLIGCEMSVSYDKYGHVESVQVYGRDDDRQAVAGA